MPDIDVTETAQNESRGSLAVGSIFAERYEIIGVLGQGGMSTVYKARQVLMDRVVALKVMHAWMLSEGKSYQRFQREAQAASQLNHPNIVKVHAFGTDGKQPFLSMDFIEGQSLSAVLAQKKKLDADQLLKVVIPAAKALAHAHSQGLLHRDIKPANIMLDTEGKVYLVDFGVAKALDGSQYEQQLTQTDGVVGTPFYMSPEQCERRELDARSDMYSFACVLYQAVTGCVPFPGDSAFAIMYSHIHEEPQQLTSPLPDWLSTTIMRMLEKKPDDRFANMDEVVAILEKGVAPNAVLRKRSSGAGRKIPKLLLPMACIAALAAGLGFWSWTNTIESKPHEIIKTETLDSVESALDAAHRYIKIYKATTLESDKLHNSYVYTAKRCYARAVALAKETETRVPDGAKKVADVYWDSATSLGMPEGQQDAELAVLGTLYYAGRNEDNEKIVRDAVERYQFWKENFGPVSPTTADKLDTAAQHMIDTHLSHTQQEKIASTRKLLEAARQRHDIVQQLHETEKLINLGAFNKEELAKTLIATEPLLMSAKAENWQSQSYLNQATFCIASYWFATNQDKGLAIISHGVKVNEEYFGKGSPEVAQFQVLHAQLLRLAKRYKEAEELLHSALPILLVPEHDSRTTVEEFLDSAVNGYLEERNLAVEQKDINAAIKAIESAAKINDRMIAMTPRAHAEVYRSRVSRGLELYEQLSDGLAGLGRQKEAIFGAKRALQFGTELMPPEKFEQYPQLAMIIATGENQKNHPEIAEPILAKACARVDKYNFLTPYSSWVFNLRGQVVEVQGRPEEALQLWLHGKAIMEKVCKLDKRWISNLKVSDENITRLRNSIKAKNAT